MALTSDPTKRRKPAVARKTEEIKIRVSALEKRSFLAAALLAAEDREAAKPKGNGGAKAARPAFERDSASPRGPGRPAGMPKADLSQWLRELAMRSAGLHGRVANGHAETHQRTAAPGDLGQSERVYIPTRRNLKAHAERPWQVEQKNVSFERRLHSLECKVIAVEQKIAAFGQNSSSERQIKRTLPRTELRQLLKIANVAAMLNCSPRTVWREIKRGKLTAVDFGEGQARIELEEVDRYCNNLARKRKKSKTRG